MGLASSATIDGFLRSDGTTTRTVTMIRVGEISNGFVMRENMAGQPLQQLAQQCIHKSYEVRTKSGDVTRHSMTEWKWPFELAAAPGVVAGAVVLNRTGLHIPANTPVNVRKDVVKQMQAMATANAGTMGLLLVYNPVVNGDVAY